MRITMKTSINLAPHKFKSYEFLDKTNFQTSAPSEFVSDAVSKVASEIIIFAEKHLHEFQPRDDHRELLELTIVFLGGTLPKGFIQSQTSTNQVDGKIYLFEDLMFRELFKMTKKKKTKELQTYICMFTVLLHVKARFRASSTPSAPRIDLDLIHEMEWMEMDKYEVQNCGM